MNAFEEIRNSLRASFVGRVDRDVIDEIESIVCVVLSKYDFKEKETSLVVYDGSDQQILHRFFLAKAVRGCTERTLKEYRDVLSRFFRNTQKHIVEVTPDDIRVYLAKKKLAKASDNYLLIIFRTLSSFYGWCAAEDVVEKNPILKVEKIKQHKKIESAFTDEEMEALRYAARTKREKALVEFLYSTGCRISEVCALNKDDVDFENLEITVLGKGNKYRTVYLSQRAKFALIDYLDSRRDNSPALFGWDIDNLKGGLRQMRIERDGIDGRLCPDNARDLIKKIGRRAGLKAHPHLLRKTVATQALRRGMPIDQVRMMLGHESIATTQIYAQTDNQLVKRSHEKFV